MIYQFKPGARIKAKAQVVGEELERLDAEGNLTAKSLVDVSRPEDAPLHNEFEWDDSIAAEAYRESQARCIIRSIEIVREEKPPVRAFFTIERKDPHYHNVDLIIRNEDTRQALLKTALGEFQALERKYEQLCELSAIYEAIDDTASDLFI